ncbi:MULTISPECIES: diguanylate cyclase [unclassified Massilia]|uniref:diguanylate cyclase n=1 Tax=unclassified Massilia TaxID=2609279 RepID=UPI0017807F29|nr:MULTISPECIES: diguanylate cyclase [unclassified Massilia]MBD8530425.1 diguanylate cyclase [Massilia sp. CFBP 13647]MBD8674277.1 diguanylate cyclase [Massilia sp. CFBP 13721]
MSTPVPAQAASKRQAAILIVDDAPAQLGMMRSMMLQQGYQTFVATSGERALTIAQHAQPDLVLLDIVLPGMDGMEVCRRLKAHPGTCNIPVIFMSAKTDTDDIVAAFDIGASDYIAKPLRLAEVCARVRAQLQFRRTSLSQQQQAERLRLIVDSMDEGLMVIEPSGRIQYTNPACDRYLGYAAGELSGAALDDLLAPSVAQEYLDLFSQEMAEGANPACRGAREVLIRRRDGVLRAMDFTLTPMAADQPLFVALLHDITHHKQSENALQRAALADPLTKIANRRHFDGFMDKEWQRAVRSGEPLSLIVLDVDHFKGYNDSLGHAAGDTCLQQVAMALQSHALRATDLAARYGGEEFVLLFGETGFEAACALAEAIRAHVEALNIPNPRSSTSRWVTASLGVATIVPTQLDDIKEFFVCADRAMYAAKDAGRNGVRAVRMGATLDTIEAALQA